MTHSGAALRLLVASRASMLAQAQGTHWLTPSEQARLATIARPDRQQEFVACRHALRALLARPGCPAYAWSLDAPEGQAPRLGSVHSGTDDEHLRLSLSHSGNYVACAAAHGPVGVDLEVQNALRQRNTAALAEMACTDAERLQLARLPDDAARQRMFLMWWSLKEAYFKSMGTGVDFSAIRRMECRPKAEVPLPLASARSWQGATPEGQEAVLAACALGHRMPECQFVMPSGIAWRDEREWGLVALLPG